MARNVHGRFCYRPGTEQLPNVGGWAELWTGCAWALPAPGNAVGLLAGLGLGRLVEVWLMELLARGTSGAVDQDHIIPRFDGDANRRRLTVYTSTGRPALRVGPGGHTDMDWNMSDGPEITPSTSAGRTRAARLSRRAFVAGTVIAGAAAASASVAFADHVRETPTSRRPAPEEVEGFFSAEEVELAFRNY